MGDKVHISIRCNFYSIFFFRHEDKDDDKKSWNNDACNAIKFWSAGAGAGQTPDNRKDNGEDDYKGSYSNTCNSSTGVLFLCVCELGE